MLLPEKVLCLVCSLHLQFISSYTQTYLKPFCSVSSIYSAITAARGAHKPPEARSSQPKRTSSSNISRNWKRNSCSTLGHQSLVNWLVGNFWVEKKRNTSFVLVCIFFRKPWVFRVIYATWFQGISGMYSQCGDVLFLLLDEEWEVVVISPFFSPKDIIGQFSQMCPETSLLLRHVVLHGENPDLFPISLEPKMPKTVAEPSQYFSQISQDFPITFPIFQESIVYIYI